MDMAEMDKLEQDTGNIGEVRNSCTYPRLALAVLRPEGMK